MVKPILGIISKKDDYKFVGMNISPQIHNFITLKALADGQSKSALFKKLIDEWIEELKESGVTEKFLMKEIGKRIENVWYTKRKAKPRIKLDDFKTSIHDELINKGLTVKQVTLITSQIKE